MAAEEDEGGLTAKETKIGRAAAEEWQRMKTVLAVVRREAV